MEILLLKSYTNMRFDIDILIVFADADNAQTGKNDVGWVSQFKKFLEFMLIQVLGDKPNIMLKGEYDTMTSPNLDNAAILIPILSKDFINSTVCLDHIAAFAKSVHAEPKNHPRTFKVFKSPLSVKEQPDQLREMLGYEMYQLDLDSGEFREYSDYFSAESERQYWMEIVDLSYDICETLQLLKDPEPASPVKNLFKRKTVYLAETGHDLSVQRTIITRELQRQGYAVLPNQTLPGNAVDIEKFVRRDLHECSMSIHLIGNVYGAIPEGSDRSIVDIQNKIAAEKSQHAQGSKEEFSRLIWISPNLIHTSERQKLFIETIRHDAEAQEGAEILQTPLEDFKNIILEELSDVHERKALVETAGRNVYLMHDKIDHQEIKPYIDVIEKSGFNVLTPMFEGKLLELRQKHIENLRALDAAIIFKGQANDQWVRMKALDLLKAPGFGRKKPILAKAILASPGSVANREIFKGQNMRVIEGDYSHSLESLKSFLLEFNA